jgi:hypothetical protein
MINKANLKKRLLFAAWGIPAGWWLINSSISLSPKSWAPILPGQVAAVFLIVMACYEYIKMLSASFPKNGFWMSYLWIIVFMGLDMAGQSVPMTFVIFILLMVVASEAIFWRNKYGKMETRLLVVQRPGVSLHSRSVAAQFLSGALSIVFYASSKSHAFTDGNRHGRPLGFHVRFGRVFRGQHLGQTSLQHHQSQ